jgi:anti-sigma factor RsiW
MSACVEFESLLIDHAAGDLSEVDRLAVERHISECRQCAEEAEAFAKTLSAIALPPRSAEERAAVASLALRTSMAWRRSERVRNLLQGAAAGFLASAAAAALILVPVGRRHTPANPNTVRPDPAVAALESWASPNSFGGGLGGLLESDETVSGDEGEP